MIQQKITAGLTTVAIAVAAFVMPAQAATTVVVTPTNTQGWSTADTNAGGDVNFITDPTSPLPSGALQLLTDSTTTAKAQYVHTAGVNLANVNELSYSTKQVSAPFPDADPAYQLAVCLTGFSGTACNPGLTGTTNATSFTTLVYEPYQGGGGAVVPGTWQTWDVDQGLFWSTRTVVCSGGTVTGTAGGPASYTLAQLKTLCPEAFVLSFGVNIGSNNPNYTVETDAVNFNGITYNFEVTEPVTPTPSVRPPTSKDACKDNGYKNFTDAQGNAFKNQGQCVSYFNHI